MPSSLTHLTDSSASGLERFTSLDVADSPRHRWYFFKEGFSHDLVSQAISDTQFEGEGIVGDPFCGSGTTILTGIENDMKGVGLEVNPFLKFVADAKRRSPKLTAFDQAAEIVLEAAKYQEPSPLEEFSTFSENSPGGRNANKWLFDSSVLRAFESAWNSLNGSNSSSARLTKLCLINAAMDVCNASKDGKCLRYRNNWQDRNHDQVSFRNALEARLAVVRDDLLETSLKNSKSKILLGDSRKKFLSEKFDLCVTSPPYLNSFDYTDVYRPELFLGKFVSDMTELRKLRLRTVRSHVQVCWPSPSTNSFGASYRMAMKELESETDQLWDKRIPQMIQAYFEDMKCVLSNLKEMAKPRASVWLVVSTSSYAGVEFPVDLIVADVAKKSGWLLREVCVLRYLRRVSGQQWKSLGTSQNVDKPYLRESVVILDSPEMAKLRRA